jgi:hypothetical protein
MGGSFVCQSAAMIKWCSARKPESLACFTAQTRIRLKHFAEEGARQIQKADDLPESERSETGQ